MGSEPLDLRAATAATFEPLVGSAFAGPDGLAFTLAAVRRFPASPGGPREEPFALDLHHPGDRIDQGAVRLEHDQLGALEVFLVPVSSSDGVVAYEAVFN